MKKLMLLLALTATIPALRAEDDTDKKPKRELTATEQRVFWALFAGMASRIAYKVWWTHKYPELALAERVAFEAADAAKKAAEAKAK